MDFDGKKQCFPVDFPLNQASFLLVNPTPNTHIGATYRSHRSHRSQLQGGALGAGARGALGAGQVHLAHEVIGLVYPLVMTNIAIENGHL